MLWAEILDVTEGLASQEIEHTKNTVRIRRINVALIGVVKK